MIVLVRFAQSVQFPFVTPVYLTVNDCFVVPHVPQVIVLLPLDELLDEELREEDEDEIDEELRLLSEPDEVDLELELLELDELFLQLGFADGVPLGIITPI